MLLILLVHHPSLHSWIICLPLWYLLLTLSLHLILVHHVSLHQTPALLLAVQGHHHLPPFFQQFIPIPGLLSSRTSLWAQSPLVVMLAAARLKNANTMQAQQVTCSPPAPSKHQRVRLMIWIQWLSPMPLIQLSTAWLMWWRGLLMHLLPPLPLPPIYCHLSHWLSTYSALISTLSTFICTCILSWNSWSSYQNYISWWLWFNRGWIVCCLSILLQCITRCYLWCMHFYCSWRQPVSEILLPPSPTWHSRSSSRKGQGQGHRGW